MPKGNKAGGGARSKAKAASGAASSLSKMPGETENQYMDRLRASAAPIINRAQSSPIDDMSVLTPGSAIIDAQGKAYSVISVSRGVPTVRPIGMKRNNRTNPDYQPTRIKLNASERRGQTYFSISRNDLATLAAINRQYDRALSRKYGYANSRGL